MSASELISDFVKSEGGGGEGYVAVICLVYYVPCRQPYDLGAVMFIVYMAHVIPYDATSASSDHMAGTDIIYIYIYIYIYIGVGPRVRS